MKHIYLDTSHWIYLVREYFELDHQTENRIALDAILKSVNENRAVFPFGMVSIYETLATPDLAQRRRMAELMVRLSKNTVLVSPDEIHTREVVNAVYHCAHLPEPYELQPFGVGVIRAIFPEEHVQNLRTRLVSSDATRIPLDRLLKLVDKLLFADEKSIETLAASNEVQRMETLEGLSGLAEQLCDTLDKFRRNANGPLKTVMRRSYVEQFLEFYEPIIEAALAKLNITYTDLQAWGHEAHSQLLSDIPHVDIQIELSLARDIDLSRSIRSNDVPDIIHLAMAMPYCDAVGADAMWRDLVHRTGLQDRYGCLVFSKLRELMPLLVEGST